MPELTIVTRTERPLRAPRPRCLFVVGEPDDDAPIPALVDLDLSEEADG